MTCILQCVVTLQKQVMLTRSLGWVTRQTVAAWANFEALAREHRPQPSAVSEPGCTPFS